LKEKGFTLIELMIVVAIIGILAAIAIPSFQSYRLSAYQASSASDVRNLLLFEKSFYTDHSEYVSISTSDKNATGLISKTVTLLDGNSALFEMSGFSNQSSIIANTDTNKQFANIGAFHKGDKKIIATESDSSNLKSKDFSGTFTQSDVPAATAAEDLATWADWKK